MQKALVAADHVVITKGKEAQVAGIKKPVLLHRPKGVGKLETAGITSSCRGGHPG
jgi:hypothetical protein